MSELKILDDPNSSEIYWSKLDEIHKGIKEGEVCVFCASNQTPKISQQVAAYEIIGTTWKEIPYSKHRSKRQWKKIFRKREKIPLLSDTPVIINAGISGRLSNMEPKYQSLDRVIVHNMELPDLDYSNVEQRIMRHYNEEIL